MELTTYNILEKIVRDHATSPLFTGVKCIFMDVDDFFAQFEAEFPSEDAAIDVVLAALLSNGFRCRYCGGGEFHERHAPRLIICALCRRELPFTAASFFDRCCSVRPILFAILMTDCGIQMSDSEFAARMGLSQSAAWKIMRSIGVVLAESSDALTVPQEFAHIVSKRSRLTQSGKHACDPEVPRHVLLAADLEMQDSDSETADTVKLSKDIIQSLRGGTRYFDNLVFELGMSEDELHTRLLVLELQGIVKSKGSFYSLVQSSKQRDLSDMASLLANIEQIHGSISKRYLWLYLASAEYAITAGISARSHKAEAGTWVFHLDDDSLLMRCLRYGAVPMQRITGRRKPEKPARSRLLRASTR